MIRGHVWLLVPILSGYLLLRYSHLTRFRLLRQSGYPLFLESALAGAVLVILARLIVIRHSDRGLLGDKMIQTWWEQFAPFDHSGTAALTLLLAAVFVAVINTFVDAHKATRHAAREHGDLVECLLQEAFDDDGLVELSTRNRKSYVGFPLESGIGARDECDVSLIPLASGYRQEETGRLILTTSYADVLQAGHAPPKRFQVVIPVSEIVSARHFDPGAHAQFQAHEDAHEAYYELKRAQDGQYMFALRSPTGEAIATSERYATKRAAEDAIESVRRTARTSTVRDET